MRKVPADYGIYEVAEIESKINNLELDLLKKANYISNKSLGTIDVFTVLKSIYNQGKADAIKCL